MKRKNSLGIFTGLLLVLSLAATMPVSADILVTEVAKEGDAAPGTAPGTTFDVFRNTRINDNGQVRFTAILTGPGVDSSNNQGIWVGSPGALLLVARQGQQAPGLGPGVVFSRIFVGDEFDQQGHYIVTALLSGPGISDGNDTGIWVGAPGALQLLVREGDPAPGAGPGVFMDGIFRINYNTVGECIFFANLIGTGITGANDWGMWRATLGSLQMVLREGDQAPGLPAGQTFEYDFFNFGNVLLWINRQGEIALSSPVANDGSGGLGVWVGPPGNLALLSAPGLHAPDTAAGVEFVTMRPTGFNDSGVVAIGGFLRGTGVSSANNAAVFVGGPNDLRLVIREGDPVPGGAPGESFNLGTFPAGFLSSNGHVNFDSIVAFIEGPGVTSETDQAHWFGPEDDVALIAREGFSPPDVFDGRLLTRVSRATAFNALNDFAFVGNLYTTFPGSRDKGNIWFNSDGLTKRVIGAGDTVELDSGDVKTVVGVAGNPDFGAALRGGGFAGSLNNNRQLAFSATLVGPREYVLILSAGEVENGAPIADAGDDQIQDEGAVVQLMGSGTDPDADDQLSFQWQQVSGAPVALSDGAEAAPYFTAPLVGPSGDVLTFQLIVRDDDPEDPKSSFPDSVNVSVLNVNDPPDCSLAVASQPLLWPPNHKMRAISIVGIVDEGAGSNEFTLSMTSVTQDEPLDGPGSGNTSPDAEILYDDAADTVLIRAERNGGGDGRVYRIDFTADDGIESCDGSVYVGVPKSRKSTPVDSGQQYDSTG